MTSSMRAFGRSILLTTTMAWRPSSSALRRTNFVWGIGPSTAVDEQQAAVGHVEHAFDFAAEVGVAGRVDDVDADAVVFDRGVLGHDRDALFAFERVRVEDERTDVLILAEDVGLLEEGIDQGGLAVVDVGDDGEVAHICAAGLHHFMMGHERYRDHVTGCDDPVC